MMKFNCKKSLFIQDQPSVHGYLKQSRSDTIKKLKTYLISRNTRKQVAALNTIMKELTAETSQLSAEVLIYTDIPGLLCDIMNNHNPHLISQVISCLILLCKNKLFFKHKHSAVVMETTCRTVRILSKDPANLPIIYSGLQLLCQTLPSSNKEGSVNLDGVIGLVKDLLYNPLFQRVHMNVMFLLQTTMKIEVLSHKDLVPILHETLYRLYKLMTHNPKRLNKYIHMAAELIRLSLSQIYNSSADDKFLSRTKHIIMRLIKFSIVPYILEMDVRKCHAGFVKCLLSCLLKLYQYRTDKELLKMSTFLASKGFLILLPHLNFHFNNSLKNPVTPLLAQLLLRLSVASLGSSQVDCQHLSAGLAALPADVALWPQLLSQPQANHIHHALLVYLYYVTLCAKSFSKYPSYFPALCHYVRHHSSPPPPSPLLKTILLLFAVGALSSAQTQSANRVVVQWLRAATLPLASVYTHHPAILLWSFSAHVTNAILQISIMSLWLKDKQEPSLKEMETLALNKRLAKLRLLDVLGCCHREIIPQALTVIQRVLAKCGPDRLLQVSHHVWSNLAPMLSTLDNPQPIDRVNNVCCLVWLACKFVPARPDTLVLVRLSYQLLRAFQQPIAEPLLSCQLYKLALTVAIKMSQAKDYRVLEMFLQDESLLQTLITSIGCGDDKVALPALRLLAYLQYGQKMYNIQVKSCRYLCEATLLRLMDSTQANTVFACLQLFRSLQTTPRPPAVVALPTDASHNLILTLYLDFHMLTLKSSDSWRCQTVLLEFCRVHNPQMELHLLTQPWTHSVVLLALQRGGLNSTEVLQFLNGWLAAVDSRRVLPRFKNYSRALCQDRLSATLTHIAQALLEHKQINSLLSDIAVKITTVGGNIPPNVVKSLKKNIVKEKVF